MKTQRLTQTLVTCTGQRERERKVRRKYARFKDLFFFANARDEGPCNLMNGSAKTTLVLFFEPSQNDKLETK